MANNLDLHNQDSSLTDFANEIDPNLRTCYSYDQSLPRPLSNEQTIRCFNMIEQGNDYVKQLLIGHNLSLVRYIINGLIPRQYRELKYRRYYANNFYDFDELMSIGTMGLMKAIDTFKLSKNIKFSSYASRCIENEILMYFRKINNYMMWHQSFEQAICVDNDGKKSLKIEDVLSDENATIDTDILSDSTKQEILSALSELEENEAYVIKRRYGLAGEIVDQGTIGKELGCSQSYVSRIETRALKKLKKSLEHMREDDFESSNNDGNEQVTVNKMQTPSGFYSLFPKHSEEDIIVALSTINQTSKTVVILYYGLNGQVPRSWNEIGLILNDTGDNMRSRGRYAITKIKKYLAKLDTPTATSEIEPKSNELQLIKV